MTEPKVVHNHHVKFAARFQVTAPPPAIPCAIKDEVELLRAGLRNKHGDHVKQHHK
ncbi:unnamed protein product [Haemonchus placei]|uniref:Uncharacterized protein n=1 Tax=Haemonchus placei TaxID=6290 RepID=A0A0N4X4Z9_HAEPC|nr:unnamed protein product [Haemonchus placei]